MTSEKIRAICPQCQAENRVDPARAANAICGRCKSALNTHASGFPVDVPQSRFNDDVLRAPVPVLVDFWAEWCGPCRTMHPIFEQTAKSMAGRVKFARVDTDEAQSLSAQMRISSIPTLVLFRDGKETARASGAMNAQGLQGFLSQHL